MSSRPVYRICAQVALSGEYLRGYILVRFFAAASAVVWQLLACAKPCCYTWPACRYLLCCPAWQLVNCAIAFVICVKNYFTLLYFTCCNTSEIYTYYWHDTKTTTQYHKNSITECLLLRCFKHR